MKHSDFQSGCGLGGLGEIIWFPPRGDREPNVQWTFGERQRGETPMEVFPRGTLVLAFWLKFQYLHKLSFKCWRGESLRGKGVAKRFENSRKES